MDATFTGDEIVSNLGKKRLEAVLAIATYSIGNATASAAPTPGDCSHWRVFGSASHFADYFTVHAAPDL